MKITIINGVNLNLLGKREPNVYGSQSFEDFFLKLKQEFPQVELSYFQSNIEGELVNELHRVGFSHHGIILNPGAYTHTSLALHDAIKAIQAPVVEVHISNTFAREAFRHTSFVSPVAAGVIVGFGLEGYRLALQSFL